MSKHLEKATENASRVKTLLHAIEDITVDIECNGDCLEVVEHADNMLYMAQEVIEVLINNLGNLEIEQRRNRA